MDDQRDETWRDRVRIGLIAAGGVVLLLGGGALLFGGFDWQFAGTCALVAFVLFSFMGHQWSEMFGGHGSGWRR